MAKTKSGPGWRVKFLLPGLLAMTLSAFAQQTTERFIPIGQSPGISGKYSTIGTLREFDAASGVLLVDGGDDPKRYIVTPTTRIWIDRSTSSQSSLVGSSADLAEGSRIEVMYRRDDRQQADWIKIEAN